MSENLRLSGFVLSVTPFQEKDAVINLFTQEKGVITIFAKGIKSPSSKYKAFFVPGAFLSCLLTLSSQQKYSCRSAESFLVPENFSYEELVLFSQFLKILKNILSSPEEDVFFLLEKGFSFLFSSQRKKQVLYILFCKLLFTLGMLSDFRECAFSGTPLKNAPSLFFFPEGKITEEEKEGGREISQGTRKILASYEYASFLENSKIALSLKEEQEVERCIQEILEYHHL